MQDRSETGKEARNVRRNQTETDSALLHSCSTLLQSFLILTQRCIACWPSAGYGICRVCSSSTTHSLLPPKSMANNCDKSDGRQQSMKPVGVEKVVGRMTDSLSATLSEWGSLLESFGSPRFHFVIPRSHHYCTACQIIIHKRLKKHIKSHQYDKGKWEKLVASVKCLIAVAKSFSLQTQTAY